MLETKRLIPRPFLATDAAGVYEYLKEPAVNCFASMKLRSLDEAKAEMQKRTGETEYYFAITLKDGGKVIGEIDAYPEAGEPHAGKDTPCRTPSVPAGCWTRPIRARVCLGGGPYLFSQKGARRIYACTEDYNLASQHLCEKRCNKNCGVGVLQGAAQIKAIPEVDTLADSECFQQIEAIVCTFEKPDSGGGSRHDFGCLHGRNRPLKFLDVQRAVIFVCRVRNTAMPDGPIRSPLPESPFPGTMAEKGGLPRRTKHINPGGENHAARVQNHGTGDQGI